MIRRDFSANPATIPMSGFVLLSTANINADRIGVEVQNQSAATIQVVLDDGHDSTGSDVTILLQGAGAGAQGGGWSSTTFRGRVRLYGAAGAQVSAYEE